VLLRLARKRPVPVSDPTLGPTLPLARSHDLDFVGSEFWSLEDNYVRRRCLLSRVGYNLCSFVHAVHLATLSFIRLRVMDSSRRWTTINAQLHQYFVHNSAVSGRISTSPSSFDSKFNRASGTTRSTPHPRLRTRQVWRSLPSDITTPISQILVSGGYPKPNIGAPSQKKTPRYLGPQTSYRQTENTIV